MPRKNSTSSICKDSFILPFGNEDQSIFIRKYKTDVYNHVIDCFEFALDNNLPVVEVFQYKNSSFIVTVSRQEFLPNLENVIKQCTITEHYEVCDRAKKLQNRIIKETVRNNEKEKISKGTTSVSS